MGARLLAAAALSVALVLPAAAQQAPAADPGDAARAQPVRIDGFRGAKWGMSEAEVKSVVASQFKISPDKLKSEPNLDERTTVMAITAPDLIEGAGIARISYIFGYRTKKLIEVNVVWGAPVDPQAKPEMVVAAANELRDLFMSQGYEPASIIVNARAKDGSIVVFTGQDAEKHATLLRLLQVPADDKEKRPASTALFLSYVMDSKNPDVFKLKNGQF